MEMGAARKNYWVLSLRPIGGRPSLKLWFFPHCLCIGVMLGFQLQRGRITGRMVSMTVHQPTGRGDWDIPMQPPKLKRIKVYLAEEQQLLRDLYQSSFSADPGMEIVGVSSDTAGEALAQVASAVEPDVIVVGIRILKQAAVETLEQLRDNCPHIGIVLLSAQYDVQGIKALREFSRRSSGGCAYLIKHTIDTVEQLIEVIRSVAQGRIIADPTVMEGLINAGEVQGRFLRDLSRREMEVLGWMAKGYRNNTIAEILVLEPKTVERHINSIYAKLNTNNAGSQHARVAAVMKYLKATGALPVEEADTE